MSAGWNSHNISFQLAIPIGDKSVDVMAGALCTLFTDLNWTLTKVKPNGEINALLEVAESAPIYAKVNLKENGDFVLEFTTTNELINLEAQGAFINAQLEEVLRRSLDIELQSNFKRALQESEMEHLQSKETGAKSKLKWFANLFFTNHPMQPVAWIMAINVVVFVLMLFAGAGFFETDTQVAVNWGAAWKRSVMLGEYWRLLTACFIHFGIAHLMGNLVGLLLATNMLMLIINRTQFLAGYIATGIIAMSVSMWWHNESVSAGASGAIFGCYGMLLGIILTPLLNKTDRVVIAMYLLFYAGFNLIYGLKDEIDNAAHIGGLLSGVPIGFMYYLVIKKGNGKWAGTVGISAVVVYGFLCSSFILYNTTYYDFEFKRLDEQYGELETKGLLYYNTDDSLLDQKLLDESIRALDKALLVSDSMVYVKDLPYYRLTYALRLREYTEYRVQEIHYVSKWTAENSTQWVDSVNYYRHKVDSMLKVFKEDI